MTMDIEDVRKALRGRRLHVVAGAVGVPLPTLEQFVTGGARLAPQLLAALAPLLVTPAPRPAPPGIKSTPAPVLRIRTP